jgi:predicted N-acetyltransferase YhbS
MLEGKQDRELRRDINHNMNTNELQTNSRKIVPTRSIAIRRANPEDAPVCGQIFFDAFYEININHGFPPHFTSLDVAVDLLCRLFSHSGFYCVVAESDGCIVGSNCLDERSMIAGVGPVTVDPSIQDRGVGRKLMEAILARARERHFPGVRLLQSAFHNRSLALYKTDWGLMLASRSRSCRDRRFRNGLKGARFGEHEFRT